MILFVWHLWLAPSALVYESTKKRFSSAAAISESQTDKPIRWALWKGRNKYTVSELSRILAKIEPSAGYISPEGIAIQRLIFECLSDDRLKYQKKYWWNGTENALMLPDLNTPVDRQVAIAWAEQNGIDVTHIK